MRIDYELAALATSQAGYLSREQADGLGMSDSSVQRRVKNGTWIVVRKGLYRVQGVIGDYKALLRGAAAILPDATISHESAAEAHGIPYIARGKAVVTVHPRTTHDFPGVAVHRSLDLVSAHRQLVESVWTTTAARTLVDSAAVLRPKALELAVDDSLARGLVGIEELQQVFEQVARRGRTGCAAMRKLIGERVGDDTVSASRLEKLGLGVFERGGLPRPIWQYPAPWNRESRIDFAWPHFCVGCECDSRRWHTRVADFQSDRDRDNLSLLHNWRIFRFTWYDFTKRPEFVITQLREAMAA
ncbi:MAG: type IV toxin-antitoxin system AbiEi family antitoxin domain-containing protein [Acidimicrobiia bacterium]